MITFIVRLVRVLGLLLLVRLMLSWLAGRRRAPAAAPRVGAAVDLVRDRVCNTYLPRGRALSAMVWGREEHFCSAACRDLAESVLARVS